MEIETTKFLAKKTSLWDKIKRESRFLIGLVIIAILFVIWLFCKCLLLWVIVLAILVYLFVISLLKRKSTTK